MNISKHNYEAFFLDYHEGNLSPEQVAELLLFVEQHPELRAEFEGFENLSLEDLSETRFEHKEELKKVISADNREGYIIGAVEGSLNPAEQALLNAFLEQHPQYIPELELYRKTRLQPDPIVFDGKESLKRSSVTIDDLMIASVEGLIAGPEDALLQSQLKENAALQYSYSLYRNTKLQADSSIVYENKEELKRRSKKARPFFYYSAAAAAILLLLSLFFWVGSNNTELKLAEGTNRSRPSKETRTAPADQERNKESNALASGQLNTPGPEQPQKEQAQHKKNKEVSSPSDQLLLPQPNNIAENNNIATPKDSLAQPVLIAEKENKEIKKQEPASLALTEKNNRITGMEFLSLREIATAKIKEKTLDEQTLEAQKKSGRVKRLSGWDLAQIISKGVSKLTGRDLEVKPKYNEEGEVTAYALGNGLEFSRGR